ncbi:MAG TPA: VWA domain-containing protein [Planctomycetes bacterium]|nr:VWA domain-containing protein [Planctomycetota bacterium]
MNSKLSALLALPLILPQEPGAEKASEGIETSSRFLFLNAPPAWTVVLLILPTILLLCWWSYRRESRLSRGRRLLLGGIRFAAILLAVLAFFRPAIEWTRSLKLRSEVHFLIDDSASMGRSESYGPQDRKAIRTLLGKTAPTDLGTLSRTQILQTFFADSEVGKALLEGIKKEFGVRLFRFSEHPNPIQSLDELDSNGSSTRIGDSLDLHLSRHASGRVPLEAVVLLSDGRNTGGISPEQVARKYRTEGIPVHCIGIGDPNPTKNLQLLGPPGPQEVLVGEEALFDLSVRSSGLAGEEATIILRAKKQSIGEGTPPGPQETLEQKVFRIQGEGKETHVKIRHIFEEVGDYLLTFEIPPLPGESNPKDNKVQRFLRVDENRIRVLYLESQPRWEYRYLSRLLRRVDKSILFQSFLFEGNPDIQESSKGLPPLRGLPRRKKELFAYHVILLGDVDPKFIGATEEERSQWLDLLKDFVAHGGGLGIIAGDSFMPESYRETPLEDLLPVVLSPFGDDDLPGRENAPYVPVLENPLAPHRIVRLQENLEVNRRLWQEGLPSMYWYYPVLRPKAGAQVLLRHPRDRNKYGGRVLTALSPFPKGLVFFQAFDSTWRWRKPYGEKYQDRYWRNVVRTLAEPRLRRFDDRVVLSLDREQALVGQKVHLRLQLLDEDYNPILAKTAKLHILLPSGKTEVLILGAVRGRSGEFEGDWYPRQPGIHSFLRYNQGIPGGKPLARRDLPVEIPKRELSNPSLNRKGLEKIAASSSGVYLPFARIQELPRAIDFHGTGTKTMERRREEIWDHAWTFFLLLGLLSLEWILRKRSNLV